LSQVLLAYWTRILVLQPQQNTVLVIRMPTLQLNHIVTALYIVLAHRTRVIRLVSLAMLQRLYLFLSQSFGNSADLIAELDELLGEKEVLSRSYCLDSWIVRVLGPRRRCGWVCTLGCIRSCIRSWWESVKDCLCVCSSTPSLPCTLLSPCIPIFLHIYLRILFSCLAFDYLTLPYLCCCYCTLRSKLWSVYISVGYLLFDGYFTY